MVEKEKKWEPLIKNPNMSAFQKGGNKYLIVSDRYITYQTKDRIVKREVKNGKDKKDNELQLS